MENRGIYKKISETEVVDKDVLTIMNDSKFIPGVQKQLAILDPICKVKNVCPAKGCSLADGAEAWFKLPVNDNCTSNQKQSIVERKDMALTEIALAAFYLDPFKNKDLLNKYQRKDARSFIISKVSENLRDQFLRFESFDETFSQIKEKTDCAFDFWTFAESEVRELSHLAMKLS